MHPRGSETSSNGPPENFSPEGVLAEDPLTDDISNVCVIGAGVMGCGIAAHLANLGFNVSLLDTSHSAAQEGLERAKSASPPHFYLPERAATIRVGSISEHPEWIHRADWVIEAISERFDAKQSLFAEIDAHLGPKAWISTNTSGFPIAKLGEGRSDEFRRRLVGVHFFNPPRYLKLLELIPSDRTDRALVERMRKFLERRVARRVVEAKDSPGFIANRYGMWCMLHAVHVAERLRLSVEEVDAITGRFLGRPASASFRLNDIVGLDVIREIASNLRASCPDDPFVNALQEPASLGALIERGWIGQKVGRGYYRREAHDLFVADFQTYAYRQRREAEFGSLASLGSLPLGERLAKALQMHDEVGEYLRMYLIPALSYADYLKERVSNQISDFDHVMEWGFGWDMGPFKLMDAIGHEPFSVSQEPYYKDGKEQSFSGRFVGMTDPPEFRGLEQHPVVDHRKHFQVRDLGQGVLAIGLTTKMGVISPELVTELGDFLDQQAHEKLVLASEAKAFSVGFDLNFFLTAISENRFDDIQRALEDLSKLGEKLEKLRVVAAVHGYCLGAGFELAMSCPRIVADAEAKIGLPEAKVGLIPAGRGATLTRLNNQHSSRALAEAAFHLTAGATSQNAVHAQQLGYLRSEDVISFHPDRLISSAIEAHRNLSIRQRPEWEFPEGPLAGMIDREFEGARTKAELTDHDLHIGSHLKHIFAKVSSYESGLQYERTAFIELCRRSLTQGRIRHMVQTGKPLKN